MIAPTWTRDVAEPNKKKHSRNRSLAAVVLAAGRGQRLKSSTAKVLHPVCGRPALWHVLQLVRVAKPTRIVVVVGHGADDVRDAVRSWGITPTPVFVEQTEQLGTGHAVMTAEKAVGRVHDVLIANGDLDPVTVDDVRRLMLAHRRKGPAATIAATELTEPGGYGRVVRERGRLTRIVEGVDATPAERQIREVATNWMAFRRGLLFATLPLLDRENRQREYYLNRAIPLLLDKGERVEVVRCDTGGVMGLNSRGGLAGVQRVMRARINARHMDNGVTLLDPSTTYVDVDVRIGRDSTIHPNTFLEGETRIGRRCTIGPSVSMVDSTVGDGSAVLFAVVEGSTIGRDVEVGPFARLRQGAELEDGSLVGNFVEMKATRLGKGSKAKHLTYLGNGRIGKGVNIGAGTVFVNYDGYDKHVTVVEDGASIGSDTMLVAPVRVGRDANTGAGSVITKDVPDGALAVERSEQRNIEGFRKRKDATHRAGDKGRGA
jgi:bifunctional UDP-N-acetylglucosamine pyrophosphorylase/glucosamine-1-phosphate N-acetyltransferase